MRPDNAPFGFRKVVCMFTQSRDARLQFSFFGFSIEFSFNLFPSGFALFSFVFTVFFFIRLIYFLGCHQ